MSRRKLKIGITCYPTYGGSGVVATELGMEMARRGHRVHFVCYDVPMRLHRFMDRVFFHEVEVTPYPLFEYPPYSLALASKLVEVASYENLDLFHVHYAVPHAASALLARQALGENAPKIITTLHGTDITLVGNDRSYLPITRLAITASDGITAVSHYLRQATYDKLNVSSQTPIEVIPNFINTEEYQIAPKEKMGCFRATIEPDAKIICHVSNFRPVKQVMLIVEVFKRVQQKSTSHLVFVGDGPDRSAAEALVHELGLEEQVHFLGKMDNVNEILNCSDVFMLPSSTESFGLAALEAMACGVPVIASRVGGLPELVIDKEGGFLVEDGDVDAMSESLLLLLEDDDLRLTMGRRAREIAVSKYSMEIIINQYEDFYYSVMEQ